MKNINSNQRNSTVFTVLFFFIILSASLSAQGKFEYKHRSDLTFNQRVDLAEKHFDLVGRGKGIGYKQFKRWKYWAAKRLDKNGYVITKAKSTSQIKKFNNKYLNKGSLKSLGLGNMTELGPKKTNITTSHSSALGRLLSIAVANDNTFNHIIVASDGGGVWKTTDGGTNWSPIFDNQSNLEVNAVTISHTNSQHYFAGLEGTGFTRSTNGGSTWTAATGIPEFESINLIRVHPTDASIIFALCQFSGILYRSTDGGASFSELYTNNNELFDLEFKPGDPTTMYLSGLAGVTRSTNSGTNWTAAMGTFDATGAVMMAVSPADPTVVYALQEKDGGYHGLFKSTNSGSSFSSISNDTNNDNNILGYDLTTAGGQAPRDMDIIVSPDDINEVHVGGIVTFKSTLGGTSTNWTQTSSWVHGSPEPFLHADQDALYYLKRNGTNRIYYANDGGIYYSADQGTTNTDISEGLGIRDFYRIDVSNSAVDVIHGGSQDNGTSVLRADGKWYEWLGADGGTVLVDHSNPLNMWGTENGAGMTYTNDGGNTRTLELNPPTPDGGFTAPLFQHPTIAATLFYGSEMQLHKSVDKGVNWTQISNFTGGGSVNYADIAFSDANTIYVGMNNGEVHKTTNGGSAWTDITPPGVGGGINWISIHPTSANHLIIALSGAANGELIMESTNGGTTWTNISSNLPMIGAQTIVFEGDVNDGIYVGMNPGLFYKDATTNGMWSNVGASRGFPNAAVVDLEIAHNSLYIGTYGRGVWKAPLATTGAVCGLTNISTTPTFACIGGMKTATITWTGNDASVTFNGGSGASPAIISAASGTSAVFSYPPTQAFFSMNLTDTDGFCTWSFNGTNSSNCTVMACTTTGGSTCGGTGHNGIAGLYNDGTSAITYSHGNNGMVGRTIFLCGGQSFCSTGASEGYGIDHLGGGNYVIAMGGDGVKSISFASSGACTQNWISTSESPTGVAFKSGRLFISGGSEIIELNPTNGTFINFWDLSSIISSGGQIARIEDGPGNTLYFSDYNMINGGFGTFDITSGVAAMLPGNMGNMVKRAVGMEYTNGWLLAVERGEPGTGAGIIWAIDPSDPTMSNNIASGFNDIFDVDYTTASGGNVLVADGGAGQIKNFACSLVNTPPSNCPTSYSLANSNKITGNSLGNFDYETDGIIESDQVMISPHMIDYDSKLSINFLNGFEIKIGALFQAFIDGCGGSE